MITGQGLGRDMRWTRFSVFGVARNHIFGENHRVKIKDEE